MTAFQLQFIESIQTNNLKVEINRFSKSFQVSYFVCDCLIATSVFHHMQSDVKDASIRYFLKYGKVSHLLGQVI